MVKLELFTIEFLYLFTIEYSCDFLSLLNPYLTIPQKKKSLFNYILFLISYDPHFFFKRIHIKSFTTS